MLHAEAFGKRGVCCGKHKLDGLWIRYTNNGATHNCGGKQIPIPEKMKSPKTFLIRTPTIFQTRETQRT
jgi:hypothetical protein